MPSPNNKKFYVTTPIYYVNARPHIGHAYTTIVADVLARRHRLLGEDTFFLTGTDEHGQKIERSAAAAGIPPQQFTDEVSQQFRTLWDRMGLTYDRYIRTTDPAHKHGAQKLFTDLYHRGAIYLSSYTGQYSIGEEMFVEGPPGTLGPDGRPTETVTEENFFFRLSDYQRPLLDLIELDILKITPETSKNEVLSFLRGDVAAAERAARPHPSEHENEPPVSNKAVTVAYSDMGHAYVPGAVRDLSVSRSSFTWGIPVPEAIQREAKVTGNHIIYVWLDALANYMTAVGYGDPSPEAQAEFARLWPADLHLVGKEITRFHCVYWPAFLLAAGLPLPKQITANGWLLFDNAKMSKSRGNVVRTETILDAFGTLCPPVHLPQHTDRSDSASPLLQNSDAAENGKGTASAVPQNPSQGAALAAEVRPPTPHERDLFAADVLRYFLLREIPFGQDGSFSFEALVTRYNADLANGYGNLVSRTLSMVQKYLDGAISKGPPERTLEELFLDLQNAKPTFDANEISALMQSLPSVAATCLTGNDLGSTLKAISMMVATTDQMLTGFAPWKMESQTVLGARSIEQSLYTAAESIRIITALLYPILPHATAKVWAQLGLGDIEQAAESGDLNNLQWGGLQPGTKLGPLAPIFPRADKGLAQIMTNMEESRTAAAQGSAKPVAASTDPAAAPRTSETDPVLEFAGTLPVAGSTATTTAEPTTEPTAPTDATAPTGITGPADAEPQIVIDDFLKVELRVAQILVAERIPKADKLLRLEVDLGYEKRQILSGIAQWYTPEELVGRRIAVVANLAPRKMRGLESHGMLLAASAGPDDKPILAGFSEDTPLGSRVR